MFERHLRGNISMTFYDFRRTLSPGRPGIVSARALAGADRQAAFHLRGH